MIIKCPNCGGTSFQSIIRNTNFEAEFIDGDFKINPLEGNIEGKGFMCNGCNAQYDLHKESDFNALAHPKQQCKSCGKDYMESELDENGVCVICRMKEKDPSFANLENASASDLFRMLAMVRYENITLSDQTTKLKEELKKAEEVSKPKRRRRKKKEELTVEETTTESEEVIDLDINESNDSDIEISDIEINEETAPDLPPDIADLNPSEE